MPNVSYRVFELNFFQRFIEAHEKMFTGNSAFKPKLSDFQSRPWMWPINLRVKNHTFLFINTSNLSLTMTNRDFQGQFFSVEQLVVYLLGNPIIWWGHCLYFIFYFTLWAVNAVNGKRGVVLSDRQQS